MTCPLFEMEPAWMRKADATVKARPLAKGKRLGTRVAHCDDQGTWADARITGRTVKPARTKVSHRDNKRVAPQARFTSSLTMSGIAHQGSLALKKS